MDERPKAEKPLFSPIDELIMRRVLADIEKNGRTDDLDALWEEHRQAVVKLKLAKLSAA